MKKWSLCQLWYIKRHNPNLVTVTYWKAYCCSLVCLCGVSVLTIYLCLFFLPFFSASKKCDFGKTRARSCWWIVTGIILQEYIFRKICLNFSNTLIFHSWPVLPKIQIPRQHWLGTVMTIHYLMVLVSIS